MKLTTTLKLATAGTLCSFASLASAAEETANLSVTALVADSCTLTAATALSFASINTSADTSQATPGSLVIVCTGNRTGVTVAMGEGENASGSARRMASTGGDLLPYSIYSDAGHAAEVAADETIWSGNITAAVPQAIAVYGQIPSGNYNAGLYSDTILVTLTH